MDVSGPCCPRVSYIRTLSAPCPSGTLTKPPPATISQGFPTEGRRCPAVLSGDSPLGPYSCQPSRQPYLGTFSLPAPPPRPRKGAEWGAAGGGRGHGETSPRPQPDRVERRGVGAGVPVGRHPPPLSPISGLGRQPREGRLSPPPRGACRHPAPPQAPLWRRPEGRRAHPGPSPTRSGRALPLRAAPPRGSPPRSPAPLTCPRSCPGGRVPAARASVRPAAGGRDPARGLGRRRGRRRPPLAVGVPPGPAQPRAQAAKGGAPHAPAPIPPRLPPPRRLSQK